MIQKDIIESLVLNITSLTMMEVGAERHLFINPFYPIRAITKKA
jgi:hypothetical protein